MATDAAAAPPNAEPEQHRSNLKRILGALVSLVIVVGIFGFAIPKVADYGASDLGRIMNTRDVIRNRAKILATFENARHFLEVQREFGSFDAFIWRFVNGKTIHNGFARSSQLPSETEESRAMSKELRKRGFRFVGPTICYAFMQAAGLVNDHLTHCFRYDEIRSIASNT